jgi:pimeloyl-ACP methyl ester carboxylesterase
MAKSLRQFSPGEVIAICIAAIAFVSACATTPKAEFQDVIGSDECVVLLHGANRSWRMMRPLADALHQDGYKTANIDYPTRSGPVEELVPMAVELGLDECRSAGATRIHFVTHSLGGIVLRHAHKHKPIEEIGRVVMLAPPNGGSEIVDKTRGIPGAELFAGEALMQLGTDENSIPSMLGPVDFELGIIAGTGTMNPILSTMLPNPDDGKVSVAQTRLEGMTDFLIVDDNHHSIVKDELVISNTLAFLRTGSFIQDTANEQ